MRKLTYILGALLLGSLPGQARNSKQVPIPHTPLLFVENKGQVVAQNMDKRQDVDYKLSVGSNMNIFIGSGAIHYQWAKEGKKPETYRLDVDLLGADKNAQVITERKQDYVEHYYLPQCSNGAKAHSFTKVTYKNIYKNIDWVLYTKDDKLEYDFVVHQGGNVKDIRIKYEGATGLISKEGAITATTPFGAITEHKPFSYNAATKNELASAFVLNNNVVSFNVAPCKGDVVIDPTLSWATYYGGGNDDWAYDVTTDTAGNVYLFGSTLSTNYIATSGAYQSSLDSNSDAYVVKFNASGVRQWASYFGGKGNDAFYSGVCDNAGNIILGGSASSTNILATPGAFQKTPGTGIIVKFNTATGNRQMASYLNGVVNSIALDNSGNIYFGGFTTDQHGIATPGGHKDTIAGSVINGFLAKFDQNCKRHWGTYYGGKTLTIVNDVCTDAEGNVYICGITGSDSGIATKGSYLDTIIFLSSYHGFLVKFNAYGNRLWGTYYGDTTQTELHGVVCDGEGNVYTGGIREFSSTLNDALLVKFNRKGQHLWAKHYGGTGSDIIHKLAANNAGDIYAMGSTNSTTGIATLNGYHTALGGGFDAFVTQVAGNGFVKWSSYYGGTNADADINAFNKGLAFNWKGAVYLASRTTSTTGIAPGGSFKDTIDGSGDAYLAKFSETDTAVYVSRPNNYITICLGINNFNLDYKVTRNFNSGNTFNVQLSDTGGSFAGGPSIGSINSNTSGTIACAIPLLSLPSDHYRLRIISSSPVDTSEFYLLNLYPGINPFVHIAVYPNDTVCNNDTITFYADTTRDGGMNPSYQWRKNNVNIPGETNASYVTTTLSDNDTICCIMTSSNSCAHAPGVSNCIVMDVSSFLPTAKIVATPSNIVAYGDTIVFSAILTNAGTNPTYQWKKNGQYIPGATHDTLRFYNGTYGDRISVKIGSSLFCAQPDTVLSDTLTVIYTGNVGDVNTGHKFALYPNPNKGQFTFSGKAENSGKLNVEILNTIGQVVYRKEIAAKNGLIHEELDLGNKPNGVYLLRVTGTSTASLRFVIDK